MLIWNKIPLSNIKNSLIYEKNGPKRYNVFFEQGVPIVVWTLLPQLNHHDIALDEIERSYNGILQGTQEVLYYRINDYSCGDFVTTKQAQVQSKFPSSFCNQNHWSWECPYKTIVQALIKNKAKVAMTNKYTST